MVGDRPRRGEIYWVKLNPVLGAETGKTRPALVIQNDIGNANADTTILATITSANPSRVYPFLVPLPDGTLPKSSLVNCAHLRTVDRARLRGAPITMLDSGVMESVDAALRVSLALT